ncbi:RNA polymerase sigma factor [Flavivirga amylovorans]|uniref:RNA polymerase sigma factor n=1 Tax=Flavivirga amylovorans TaxID=870486 RepID=A0ABT8X4Z5_9FLAO|nr:RNA polymerase sigma factor [Flavivirga amylovorans]MDO5988748.1 RNA polymerase sigma factor [Flavivirga amylovorans]
MNDKLKILVEKANSGDKKSLEKVVIEIKDLVYNLALKMLLIPEEAKDATQEILIKVITHLGTFNYKSQFKTWVYRVATNYLLTHKEKKSLVFSMSFDEYSILIDSCQSDVVHYTQNEGELSLLEEEVKVSCTQGLLMCLNSVDRMVYVLSEILEFDSIEGAKILDITPENFRKKLSRARAKIRNFLNNKCGLVNSNNPCRCSKKIDFLINQDIINPKELRFAQHSKRSIDLISKIKLLEDTVSVYQTVPNFKTPEAIIKEIQKVIHAVNF